MNVSINKGASGNASHTPEAPSTLHSPDAPSKKSPLGRFGRLPELAGPGFLPLGLFARLPLAMLTIGALALVQAVSQSYAIGGYAAGAVGVGSAIGAPVLGFLADRSGQRPVLLIAALANTLAIAGLIAATYLVPDFNTPSLLLILAAALIMGGTCPQVGPLARVRWMALTGRSPRQGDLDTAMSYESTADELTFVMGPALVGLLASAISPWLPLALAALMTITLVSAFAVHRTHYAVVPTRKIAAGHHLPAPASRTKAADWWLVSIPVLGMVCMGTFFGGTQTALFAFAGAGSGTASLGGLLYAVMGLSSAAAALSVAYWPAKFRHPVRWLASAAAMAALTLLLFLPETTTPMLIALFALGISVGPTMVTIFNIGGKVAPENRLGTVMTMLASGIVAGTAIGSAIAGSLAENTGYELAFFVSTAAATGLLLLGLLTAVVVEPRVTRRTQRS
ncbi:MFS transporter [Arthrobacter sp. H14]|uniref:MFS transporter n=1 Tax=Arthrobacter sp. H14 TaxID=1312959 RepID=UPI0004BCBCB5